MSDLTTTSFKTAQVLGITSSAFLSGFAFSASFYGMPAVNLAPVTLRTKQWLKIYDLGKLVSPTVGMASAAIWGYLAYASKSSIADSSIFGAKWKLYALAGIFTGSILPWTLLVMMPANVELMKRAQVSIQNEKEVAGDKTWENQSEKLLSLWTSQNWMRAILPMIGAGIGLWAAL